MKNDSAKIFIIFFSVVFLFSFFVSFNFAFAQGRQLEIDYPDVPGAPAPKTVTAGLPAYVKYVFNFGIIIFGLIVLGVLVFGGIKYLLSAGKPGELQEAKNQILAAFLGLVFLLSSYLILTTINPQLVVFDILKPFSLKVFRCTVGQNDTCDSRPGCEEKGSCYCDFGTCRANYEAKETTLIAYEIPLGQLIEKGVWNKENVNRATTLLNELENFLKKEVSVNPTFNRISDLSKYLVSLTEDCRCGSADAVCAAPEAGAGGVGCFGNPCKDSREKIQKVVDIITQKVAELNDFKKRVEQQFRFSLKDGDKFVNAYEEMSQCIERGSMLTLADYLATAQFFTDQGWKTELRKNPYFPDAGADALTFYCIKGGTIFDLPKTPLLDLPELPPKSGILTDEPITGAEPVFCPAVLPIGELLQGTGYETLQTTEVFRALLSETNTLSGKLQKLLDSVSQCSRKDACGVTCAKGPNPCLPGQGVCTPIPFTPNQVCCNPLSLPTCLLCIPGVNTLSPNLQAKGTCEGNPDPPYRGSPCPRDDIQETLKEIQRLDDEIPELIKEVKSSLTATPFILETPEGNLNLLEGTKAAAKFCTSGDPENPNIFLVNCLSALGNTGPDGNIIANCHPQSFFCCTADKSVADRAGKVLPQETRELTSYYQPPTNLTGECTNDIIETAKQYEGIQYRRPDRAYPGGSPPASISHCAYRAEPGPEGVATIRAGANRNWGLDCSGFVSRVYREVGLLPDPPIYTPKGWCNTTITFKFSPFLYRIPNENVQKGDLVFTPGHVTIFLEGNINGKYQVWHEGTCTGGSKVCQKERNAKNYRWQQVYRAKNSCSTFRQYRQ